MIKTKKEFLEMPVVLGGDLWNQYKLCKLVYSKYPDAKQIEYHIGTGLWVSVKITFENNEVKEEQFYDK